MTSTTPKGFPKVVPPKEIEGADCRLTPYWLAIKQWRECDKTWPPEVYWHLFQSQIKVSEKVLDKCYQNFIKVGKFSAKTEDI